MTSSPRSFSEVFNQVSKNFDSLEKHWILQDQHGYLFFENQTYFFQVDLKKRDGAVILQLVTLKEMNDAGDWGPLNLPEPPVFGTIS